MATVLRNTGPGKADDMSPVSDDRDCPERVEAELRTLAEACAHQHGGGSSAYLAGAYRIAYQKLWDRFQAETIPFMAEEGGRS